MAEYLRSVTEVANGCNNIFPFESVPDKDEARFYAIIEVLQRIPEEDYQRLDELVETYTWYTPSYDALAEIVPFRLMCAEAPPGGDSRFEYVRVIYLSPRLNVVDFDVAVACVAHELAHILLGHELIPPTPAVDERQEKEAWEKLREWGFGREVEAHQCHRNMTDE